jgi:hypothetical protein
MKKKERVNECESLYIVIPSNLLLWFPMHHAFTPFFIFYFFTTPLTPAYYDPFLFLHVYNKI